MKKPTILLSVITCLCTFAASAMQAEGAGWTLNLERSEIAGDVAMSDARTLAIAVHDDDAVVSTIKAGGNKVASFKRMMNNDAQMMVITARYFDDRRRVAARERLIFAQRQRKAARSEQLADPKQVDHTKTDTLTDVPQTILQQNPGISASARTIRFGVLCGCRAL